MVNYYMQILNYAKDYPGEGQAREKFNALLRWAKRRYPESDGPASKVLSYVNSICCHVVHSERNEALEGIYRQLNINGGEIRNLEKLLMVYEQEVTKKSARTLDVEGLNGKEVVKELEQKILGYRSEKLPRPPSTKSHVKTKRPGITNWKENFAIYR